MPTPDVSRARLLTAAFRCFAESGYEATTLDDVARSAGVPLHAVFELFPAKAALASAAYHDLVGALGEVAAELPATDAADRVTRLLSVKLDKLDAQRPLLLALAAAALDPDGPLGVLSPATASVRSRMLGLVRTALAGATDAPADLDRVTRLVYALHLGLVLLWTQDPTAAREALPVLASAPGLLPMLAFFPGISAPMQKLDAALSGRFVAAGSADAPQRARELLRRLFSRRRLAQGSDPSRPPTEAELAPHLPVVEAALAEGRPLDLVLPAFPAKSPSQAKTLGAVPDLGERVALAGLAALCAELSEAHPAGVRLWVCSDGSVFADVVEVPDVDVVAYGAALDREIAAFPALRRFDLAEVFAGATPEAARAALLETWAEDPDVLAAACEEPALARQLDGLHRFVFEDLVVLHPELSRTAVRKLARGRAIEVLRRSRAWGRLVAAQFPDALRLSIHPQGAVSDKIGVHLLPTDDVWLTPWHAVAVVAPDGVHLAKRADAEAAGAVLVEVEGRPDHFVARAPADR
jgi:pyoverdine/dityrosine biosynthesis protein Dit1/AcrR family transcriptional regulator